MIQLAIIGPGAWGRRLVDAVQGKSDRVRFVAAVIPRPEKIKDFADAKNIRVTPDLGDVLTDSSVHGIVSCGPAQLHAEHSLAALKSGKPVLAVKPMSLLTSEATMLEVAARQQGVLLALGYNRCFLPHVAALREELQSGALGEVLHTEGNFCVDRYFHLRDEGWKAAPEFARPGSLADHALYLTIETLGRLVDVHAVARHDVSANRLADVVAVLARSQGGGSAFLTGIGTTAELFRFHVFGSKGWAELRGDSVFRLETTSGRKIELNLPRVDAELLEVEAFADAVAGRSKFPVPVEDAVHGVAALEAIARSAGTGRVVAI
jgi:predicted dehydrogenase